MKHSIVTLLTALALTCALCLPAGAETLAELRQETAGGWHETLTDKKGASVVIDAEIDIRPGAEEVSALRVSAGQPVPESKLDIFDGSYSGRMNEKGLLSQLSPTMIQGLEELGAFLGAEPQGRKIPDVTAKGGLSYEAALKTADEIVNHLFGTSMKDYELEFVEIAHWENRDTCRYEFSPVVGGLPLGSAPFDLDVRSQEDWGVSFVLYTVDGVETPALELAPFAKVQETLKAALAKADVQTALGLFPEETLTSIENIRLEYLTFADGKGRRCPSARMGDGRLLRKRRPTGQKPVLLRPDRPKAGSEGRAVSVETVRENEREVRNWTSLFYLRFTALSA